MNATMRKSAVASRFGGMSRRMAAALLALVAGACREPWTAPPRTGQLLVSVQITGAAPDDNEIVVVVDSTRIRAHPAASGRLTMHELPPGVHTVELRNLAPNCAVVGGAMRRVTVEGQQTATVAFGVTCDEVTPLTQGTEPAWSPDGRTIVFTRADGVFAIDADGANLHRITRGPHSSPAWQP